MSHLVKRIAAAFHHTDKDSSSLSNIDTTAHAGSPHKAPVILPEGGSNAIITPPPGMTVISQEVVVLPANGGSSPIEKRSSVLVVRNECMKHVKDGALPDAAQCNVAPPVPPPAIVHQLDVSPNVSRLGSGLSNGMGSPTVARVSSATFSSPSARTSSSSFAGIDSMSTVSGSAVSQSSSGAPVFGLGGCAVAPQQSFLSQSSHSLSPSSSMSNLSIENLKLPDTMLRLDDIQVRPVQRCLMLFNPHSGAQKGQAKANKSRKMLEARGVTVDAISLTHSGHAEEICERVDLFCYDALISVGGDGTFHECVNGLMKRRDNAISTIPIVMVPAGTGNSFALELQGDIRISHTVDRLCRGASALIDLVKIQFPKSDGTEEVSYSFNSIHWGLASRVNVSAEKLRWMGHSIRYTTAALLELFKGQSSTCKVLWEDGFGNRGEYDEKFCMAIANNIFSTAKGMKMVPKAKLNDGLIDLLLLRSSATMDLANVFKRIYDGSHTDLPFVEYRQVRKFAIIPYHDKAGTVISTEDDPELAEELIDVDGELKGSTPFYAEVMPRCLRVII